jgi:hypothetical protein
MSISHTGFSHTGFSHTGFSHMGFSHTGLGVLKIIAWPFRLRHPIPFCQAKPLSLHLGSLEWEPNAQEQSRLFHVVVLVAENANTTWLHHQAERERKVIAQPSLGKCSGCVAMCDQDDVLGLVVVHVRCLDLANLLDQDIETRSEFGRRPGGLSVGFSRVGCLKCFLTRHLHSHLSKYPTPGPCQDHAPYAAL